MAKKVTKTAHGGVHRAHSRMKRRFAAGLLAVTLAVTGAFGAGPYAWGPRAVQADEDAKVQGVVATVSGKVLNGIKAYGKHAAVDAMLEVGDAIDEGTGTNAGSEITGFIYTYILGKDSTSSQLAQITALCNDILNEMAETQALVTDTESHTQSMIADQDVTNASDKMDEAWKASVTNIVGNFKTPMENYKAYMDAAKAYRDGTGTKSAAESAGEKFQRSLAVAYKGDSSDATIDRMLKGSEMNSTMITTFQSLIDQLDAGGENYVDKAAQLAYTQYAFSQDQYRFITGEMDRWIEEITKFEMMYEEYLAWQGRYLKEHGETDFLTNTYPGLLTTLGGRNIDFQDELEKMLDRKITVCKSPSIKLKYAQFFKPEDAGAQRDASKNGGWTEETPFQMKLKINYSKLTDLNYEDMGYKESECNTISYQKDSKPILKFYRTGVVNNGGVDLYGISEASYRLDGLDHKNDKSMKTDQHLVSCDWMNFTRDYHLGDSTYRTVGTGKNGEGISKDELSKLTNLFGNSIVMANNDDTPAKYLSPYMSGSSGTLYVLLNAFDINHRSSGSTGYTDFYGLRLDAQNAGTLSATKLEGKTVQKASDQKYKLIVCQQKSSQVTISTKGNNKTTSIQVDGEIIEKCTPGDMVSVKISVPQGYRVGSLKWIRRDNENLETRRNIEEVIVDGDSAKSLVKEDDGTILMDLPVPYTNATLKMTTVEDERTYATLDCQDDTNYSDAATMGHIAWSDGSSSTRVQTGESVNLKIQVHPGYQLKSLAMVRHTKSGDATDVLLDEQAAAALKTSDGSTTFGDTEADRTALYTVTAPETDATVKLELAKEEPEPEPVDENTPTDGDTPTDDAEPASNIPEHEVQVDFYSTHADFGDSVVGDEALDYGFEGLHIWHIQSGVGKLHFRVKIANPMIPDSLTITQHTDRGDITETIFDETNVDQLNWTNDDGTAKVDPWDNHMRGGEIRCLTIDRDFDYEYDTEVVLKAKEAPTTTSNKVNYQKTGKGEAAATGVKDTDIKKLEIPDTVEIKGETLKVTSIDPEAFKGLEKLEEVILGKHIESIGKKAFHGAKRLKALKILSKKLKKAKVEAALHGSEIEDVTVPKSVLKKYKKFLTKLHTKSKHDLFVDSDEDE